jgi:hypothetical protein
MVDPHASEEFLSDEEVRQVVALAVELDVSDGPRMSLETLRRVVGEASISAVAFERALAELRDRRHRDAERQQPFTRRALLRIRQWLSMPVEGLLSPGSIFDSLARTGVALAGSWLLVNGSVEIARVLGWGPDGLRLRLVPEILGFFVAAGLANRLRARGATIVLLGIGGALGSRFVVEQVLRTHASLDHTAEVALLGAGVAGVVLGYALARNRSWHFESAEREGDLSAREAPRNLQERDQAVESRSASGGGESPRPLFTAP